MAGSRTGGDREYSPREKYDISTASEAFSEEEKVVDD